MKAYEIPVSRGVLKMLKRDYGYSKHMRIDRMMFCRVHGDLQSWGKYLDNTSDSQVRITLVCRYASKGKLYTVARLMEYEFRMKMLLFVEAAVYVKMEAAAAIRLFMDKYDLTMEELEMETAYKAWQRYQKKEKEKNLLPLW